MKDTKPILLFKGDTDICYGILNTFSTQLRDALFEIGEEVVFFDPATDDIRECFGKEYKLVLGFMETFFYNTLSDGSEMLFDKILGPKFNYWPDHPSVFYEHIQRVPDNFYVLTQDRNYVRFINKYYKGVKAFYLPPAAGKCDEFIPFAERKYDISFVGTYLDWQDGIKSFSSDDPNTRIIRDTYLDLLVREPDLTAEEAFDKTLKNLGADVSDEQFVRELHKVHKLAGRGVSRLYREEIVKTILDAGYTLDVFGNRWKDSPFADAANLRIHKEVASSDVQEVYKNSKVSLNVMTWHKDCITERVLEAMASGSIVLTDTTKALEESFISYPDENSEIVLFSLKEINKIPDLLERCMNDEALALRGKERVEREHSWVERAKQLVSIAESLN